MRPLSVPLGHFGITKVAADACAASSVIQLSQCTHSADDISRGCALSCMGVWHHANEENNFLLHPRHIMDFRRCTHCAPQRRATLR